MDAIGPDAGRAWKIGVIYVLLAAAIVVAMIATKPSGAL